MNNISRKARYSTLTLLCASSLFAPYLNADDAISVAEQAAIAAKQQKDRETFIDLCYHTILSAPESIKADFIESLDGKTCEDAAEDAIGGSASTSE